MKGVYGKRSMYGVRPAEVALRITTPNGKREIVVVKRGDILHFKDRYGNTVCEVEMYQEAAQGEKVRIIETSDPDDAPVHTPGKRVIEL